MRKTLQILKALLASALIFLINVNFLFAADLHVDTTTDTGGAGCELREATTSVNSAADFGGCFHTGDNYGLSDKIDFIGGGVGTHNLGAGAISITAPVTIEGPTHLGTPTVTVDGGGADRVFDVNNPDGTAVTIRNLEITNGSNTNGGLVFLHDASVGTPKTLTLDFDDLRNGNAATNGGAVHTGQNNIVNLNNSEVDNNIAGNDGGAVYVDSGTTFNSDKTVYHDNTAANNGGAIDLQGGTTSSVIDRGLFEKNTTTLGDGGAVHISNGSVNIKRTTVGESVIGDGNGNSSASEGGGVAADGTANLDLDSSFYRGNTAAFAGGGVNFTSSGTFTCDGTDFLGNSSTSASGGAVHITGASSAGFATVEFGGLNPGEGNSVSGVGGGLFVEDMDIGLFEVNFYGNSAGTDGGGLYYSNSSGTKHTLTYNSGEVTNNESSANGGGIFIDDNTIGDIEQVIFDSNHAVNQAGALFMQSGLSLATNADVDITDSSFTNNSADIPADFAGGAIHLGHWGTLDLDNIIATGNLATAGGGGFLNAYSNVVISILDEDSDISGNQAQNGNGGAFRIQSGQLNLIGHINNNTATDSGGAIYSPGDFSGGVLAVTANDNTEFLANQAVNNGGAISMLKGLINLSFTNLGELANGNSAGNFGGAIYGENTSVVLNSAKFVSNTANNDGGAIYLNPLTVSPFLTDDSGNYSDNQAISGSGGAIHINNGSGLPVSLSLTNSSFTSNFANLDGGAIYLDPNSGGMTLNSDTSNFYTNSSTGNGGAIYCDNTSLALCALYFTASSPSGFYSNSTTGTGGAISSNIGSFGVDNLLSIIGLVFDGNTADTGAVIAMNVGSAFLYGLQVTNNTATTQGIIGLGHDAVDDPDLDFQFISLNIDNNIAPAGSGITILDWGAQFAVNMANNVFSNNQGQGAFQVNQAAVGPGVTTTINDSSFLNNVDTSGELPAIIYADTGSLEINQSTFQGNSGTVDTLFSAVIVSGAPLSLNRSAIVNNLVGAIYSTELIAFFTTPNVIANNTFAENIFDDDTLMSIDGDTNFFNNTIYNNEELAGGAGSAGLMNLIFSNYNFANNIIAANLVGPETPSASCVHSGTGTVTSLGHNLIEDTASCIPTIASDITNALPSFGPLALNGGTTLNYILTGNSPALDGGDDLLADIFGQRRERRPIGAASDIGSTDVADTFNPNLSLITPIPPVNPTAPAPTFIFSSDENVIYSGANPACATAIVNLGPGLTYTATVTGLGAGSYNCDFTFTDAEGNPTTLPTQNFVIEAPVTPPAPPTGGGGSSGGSSQFGQQASEGGNPPSNPSTPTPNPIPNPNPTPVIPTTPANNPAVNPPANPNPSPNPTNPPSTNTSQSPSSTNLNPVTPVTPTTPEIPSTTPDETHAAPLVLTPATAPFTYGLTCQFDYFAQQYNLPGIDSSSDFDGDGLSDKLECLLKTNPRKADTDDDKYNDGREVLNLFTNPLIPNRDINKGVEIITPEDQLKSADATPFILGTAPANQNAAVYLFLKSDFDDKAKQLMEEISADTSLSAEEKVNLYNQQFTDYVHAILSKFLAGTLDQENPEEAKFINRINDLGQTPVSENGLFILDSQKEIKDGTYLIVAISNSVFSKEKQLTIDQTLQVLNPLLEKFDNKPIPADALLGQLRIEVTPGTLTPVLVGKVKEASRIVANWESNISSSALLADSLDEEFRLSSPVPLSPGQHKVYVTAYRQSDGAQSETIGLNFTVKPPLVSANNSYLLWVILAIISLLLLLLLLRLKRHHQNAANTATASSTANATTGTSTIITASTSTPASSAPTSNPNPVTTPTSPSPSSSAPSTTAEITESSTNSPDMMTEIFGDEETKQFEQKQNTEQK